MTTGRARPALREHQRAERGSDSEAPHPNPPEPRSGQHQPQRAAARHFRDRLSAHQRRFEEQPCDPGQQTHPQSPPPSRPQESVYAFVHVDRGGSRRFALPGRPRRAQAPARRKSGARRRSAARAKRRGASSFRSMRRRHRQRFASRGLWRDHEGEVAFSDVRVHGDHAPFDPIATRRKLRQRHLQ